MKVHIDIRFGRASETIYHHDKLKLENILPITKSNGFKSR